ELKKGIEQALYYDEFAWLEEHPRLRYRSRRLAEGLENILMTCPKCGRTHTILTKGRKVLCEHCGLLTAMDARYAFDQGFRFKNLLEWYEWQKSLIGAAIDADDGYTLSEEVELRLPGTGKGLTRHGGHGTCTLSRQGLTYRGSKDGQQVELSFSIQRVYRLLFGAGQNFEIYNGTEILYFVPRDTRTAVDWYMTSMLLHDKVVAQGA
ncbi:MAG: hypothetical protein IJP03_05925, partial [Christensenellaceae bacterium]|nr:hypothetical protein [Christensenellaceae bacterium]